MSTLSLLPSTFSIAFRSNLATLIRPLRRARPRIPFWRLAAHRIPTLWGLYRGLIRDAPSCLVKEKIRKDFKTRKGLTSARMVKHELERGYHWLEKFQSMKAGDARVRRVLDRYEGVLKIREEKRMWRDLAKKEVEWRKRLHSRPILTGALIRPSIYNKALPRMKRQPVKIGKMIAGRVRRREKRAERATIMGENIWMVQHEQKIERALLGDKADAAAAWSKPILDDLKRNAKTFERDDMRAASGIPEGLRTQVMTARKERGRNKARERERELRGEILPITLRRARKRPPAEVLAKTGTKRRDMESAARGSLSWSGYVGEVKRKLGWRVRKDAVRDGFESRAVRKDLDAIENDLREAQTKRRMSE